MAAYKLLQNKAYNNVSRIFTINIDGELWTMGGTAFIEKGAQEMRLRKDAIDQRELAETMDIPLNFGLIYKEPVTHWAHEEDDYVEVATEHGSLYFNSIYFQYFNARYPFAKTFADVERGLLLFMSGDNVLAMIAERKKIATEVQEETVNEHRKRPRGLAA